MSVKCVLIMCFQGNRFLNDMSGHFSEFFWKVTCSVFVKLSL